MEPHSVWMMGFAIGVAASALAMYLAFVRPMRHERDLEISLAASDMAEANEESCWEVLERHFGQEWAREAQANFSLSGAIDRVCRWKKDDLKQLDLQRVDQGQYITDLESVLLNHTKIGRYASLDGLTLREYVAKTLRPSESEGDEDEAD